MRPIVGINSFPLKAQNWVSNATEISITYRFACVHGPSVVCRDKPEGRLLTKFIAKSPGRCVFWLNCTVTTFTSSLGLSTSSSSPSSLAKLEVEGGPFFPVMEAEFPATITGVGVFMYLTSVSYTFVLSSTRTWSKFTFLPRPCVKSKLNRTCLCKSCSRCFKLVVSKGCNNKPLPLMCTTRVWPGSPCSSTV